jgi:hypothetical protein
MKKKTDGRLTASNNHHIHSNLNAAASPRDVIKVRCPGERVLTVLILK